MLKAIEESKNEANAVKAQAQDEPPPIQEPEVEVEEIKEEFR